METDSKKFGQWLRERREEADLSQEDLAQKITGRDGKPISAAYVSKIERGLQDRISPDKIDDLARALGVSSVEARKAAGFQVESTDAFSGEALTMIKFFEELPPEFRPSALAALKELLQLSRRVNLQVQPTQTIRIKGNEDPRFQQ